MTKSFTSLNVHKMNNKLYKHKSCKHNNLTLLLAAASAIPVAGHFSDASADWPDAGAGWWKF